MPDNQRYTENPILEAPLVERELRIRDLEVSGTKEWQEGVFYSRGSFVAKDFNGKRRLYWAPVSHNSGPNFATDLASSFWIDLTADAAGGGDVFISGEVTNHSDLPPAGSNPGKRYFVNENQGVIGMRKLRGIYRSDGSEWVYMGYDRDNTSIKVRYESNPDTNAYTDSDKSKLDGIESGAEVNQSDAEIKAQYENNPDTNAYTDAEKSKLIGIEAGAEVNNLSDSDANSLTGGGENQLHSHPVVFDGKLSISSSAVVNPPTITSDAHNYNPSGFEVSSLLRLSSSNTVTITGFQAPSPAEHVFRYIVNVGSAQIQLVDNDLNSLPENRIILPTSLTIAPDGVAMILYDVDSLRWRVLIPG